MESYFENIDQEKVETLRNQDPTVSFVSQRQATPLSFSFLRKTFGRQNDTHGSLNRGRAILPSPDHLDQYLYSHGLMIQSQWDRVSSWLKFLDLNLNDYRIIDYGCGQGIAGLLLSEYFTPQIISNSSSIFLIEPSDVALIRAEAIYRKIAPFCPIYCLQKNFLELSCDDFEQDKNLGTLHIFSNVVDIEGFDPIELLEKTLTLGRNILLVVSHDRDCEGGTERIIGLKSYFENYDYRNIFNIYRSVLFRFECDNPGRSDSIGWILDVDVNVETEV